MDWTNVTDTVVAAGILAIAAAVIKISVDIAGFKEWRRHVDVTLRKHSDDIQDLKK
jgi:hypothetical protein